MLAQAVVLVFRDDGPTKGRRPTLVVLDRASAATICAGPPRRRNRRAATAWPGRTPGLPRRGDGQRSCRPSFAVAFEHRLAHRAQGEACVPLQPVQMPFEARDLR